ncbi:MAG: hypothetical protein H0T89_36300 [Deltaproteobacteria bacterium]|nr:hypothetical protein [Deltaproteobacteria bacterium]MDQ3298270.1 hypothetical protein [Myxococcota bacterium]
MIREIRVEAAGIEIYRDANNIERLLHIQELGVPGDLTVSAVIWWPRAERGQSDREWVGTFDSAQTAEAGFVGGDAVYRGTR